MKKGLFFALSLAIMVSCAGSGSNTKAESETMSIGDSSTEASVDSLAVAIVGYDDDVYHTLTTKNLGTLRAGEIVEGRVALSNDTGKPMVIIEAKGSCGCIAIDFDKQPFNNGEVRYVKFTYDSKTKEGKQLSHINVKTSAGKYVIELEANVI